MIDVLIVDDHKVLVEGLAAALEMQGDIRVAGTAGSIAQALEVAARVRPQVALVDYHLPDGSGADAARRLRERDDPADVIMLSADSTDEAFVESVQAGAAAYLSKVTDVAVVADAVRRVAAGEVLLPPDRLAEALRSERARAQRRNEVRRRLDTLTPREREVLLLLSEGLTSRELAERLSISVPTARGHVQIVIEKLDAHSREEALRLAVEGGLLERRVRPDPSAP